MTDALIALLVALASAGLAHQWLHGTLADTEEDDD